MTSSTVAELGQLIEYERFRDARRLAKHLEATTTQEALAEVWRCLGEIELFLRSCPQLSGAKGFFENSLRCAERVETRLRSLDRLAFIAIETGEFEEADSRLNSAFEVLENTANVFPSLHLKLLNTRVYQSLAKGEIESAVHDLRVLLATYESRETDLPRLGVTVLQTLAQVELSRCNLDAARNALETALSLCEKHALTETLDFSQICRDLSFVEFSSGNFTKSIALSAQSYTVFQHRIGAFRGRGKYQLLEIATQLLAVDRKDEAKAALLKIMKYERRTGSLDLTPAVSQKMQSMGLSLVRYR